jgi:hypothetical protein
MGGGILSEELEKSTDWHDSSFEIAHSMQSLCHSMNKLFFD